jgi:hypothetical protein
MASGGNFNVEDPAKQEAIRRGTHEYIPTAGKHGMYVARAPRFEEYPKMMAKHKKPEFAAFKGTPDAQVHFEEAVKEWDGAMMASRVNNKAEELQWLKANG